MLKQSGSLRSLQDRIGSFLSIILISPNQLTILSLVVAVFGSYFIAIENLPIGLILFAFAALFDAADGAVARARGDVTPFGGFLDGVVDRFVEALFLFSFMFYSLPIVLGLDPCIWLAGVIFLGTCMPSFIRAYADHKGAITKEKALALGGIFERSERLLVLIIGLGAGIFVSMDYFVYALIVCVVFSSITIIQRIFTIAREQK